MSKVSVSSGKRNTAACTGQKLNNSTGGHDADVDADASATMIVFILPEMDFYYAQASQILETAVATTACDRNVNAVLIKYTE